MEDITIKILQEEVNMRILRINNHGRNIIKSKKNLENDIEKFDAEINKLRYICKDAGIQEMMLDKNFQVTIK